MMALDHRLEGIVSRWRGTTFAGERDACESRGEVLARRSGKTFAEVVSIFDARPSSRPSVRRTPSPTMRVQVEADLRRVVRFARALREFDLADRDAGHVVRITCGGRLVATIACADDALAYNVEMICTSVIIRREYEAEAAEPFARAA